MLGLILAGVMSWLSVGGSGLTSVDLHCCENPTDAAVLALLQINPDMEVYGRRCLDALRQAVKLELAADSVGHAAAAVDADAAETQLCSLANAGVS